MCNVSALKAVTTALSQLCPDLLPICAAASRSWGGDGGRLAIYLPNDPYIVSVMAEARTVPLATHVLFSRYLLNVVYQQTMCIKYELKPSVQDDQRVRA